MIESVFESERKNWKNEVVEYRYANFIQKLHCKYKYSKITLKFINLCRYTNRQCYNSRNVPKMLVVSGILNGEFELGNETYRDTTNFYNFEK